MKVALTDQFEILAQRLAATTRPGITDINAATDFAIDANAVGRADLAIAVLEPLAARVSTHAKVWQMLGLAYREEQRMGEAASAFDRAAKLSPQDVRIALGKAQIALETGKPAAEQFSRIRQIAGDDYQLALSTADAVQSEGKADEAAALLDDMLRRHPDWVAGHEALVRLRTIMGKSDPFKSFADAAIVAPQDAALRIAWIRALAQQDRWEAAKTTLEDMRGSFGDLPQLDAVAAYLATETGDHDVAQSLFERTASLDDPGIILYRIRHCLRTGRVDQAATFGEALVKAPAANVVWPYLSLAWRLLDDDRARWLDGDPPYVRVIDLGFSDAELAGLATLLRQLHTAREHLPEQSVRGGTQTDKPLFHRLDPEIRHLREQVLESVRNYVDALPPCNAAHPLLDTPRGNLLFEGSWSVRLRAQGFHTMHTHPAGWISSALYISLPDKAAMGAPPAGWLDLGSPPPELGLDLNGYAQVEPKPGRLVLFPSTMWHGTVPFNDGERLTVAFDVRRPVR